MPDFTPSQNQQEAGDGTWAYPDIDTGGKDPWEEHLRRNGLLPPRPERPPPVAAPTAAASSQTRETAYAEGAFAAELARLGSAVEGERNATLFGAAANLRKYVRAGWLGEARVSAALRQAAASVGLTDLETEKTIASAYRRDDASGSVAVLPDGDWEPVRPARQIDAPPDEVVTPARPSTRLRIETLRGSQVHTRTAEYVWAYGGRGRIQRGTVCLLGGRPGAGKSTCARWMTAGFTRGGLEGCWRGRPQNVAYLGAEESLEYTLAPGLIAAGADMNRVFFPRPIADDGRGFRLLSQRDENLLGDWMVDNGITALFADPVMSTIDGKTDINRNNEVRSYIEPYARIAERIDGVVIGVAHLNKAPTGDVVAGLNGSSAFGEVARSVFGFAKDPDSDDGLRVMSQAKNSTGPEDLSLAYRIETMTVTNGDMGRSEVARFVLVGDSERTVSDVLRGSMDHADDEAVQWLREYLVLNGRTPSKDVKRDANKDAGHSERTIQRAASRLRIVSERVGFPAQTYWSLPPDAQSRQPEPKTGTTGTTGAWGEYTSNNNAGQGTSAPVVPVVPVTPVYASDGTTGSQAQSATQAEGPA